MSFYGLTMSLGDLLARGSLFLLIVCVWVERQGLELRSMAMRMGRKAGVECKAQLRCDRTRYSILWLLA